MEIAGDGHLAPQAQPMTTESHYMRSVGRTLCTLELWAICRGDDVRGSPEEHLSLGKLFGAYAPPAVVGPDPFYKMQLLKDDAKANKVGRPELIGVTRHRDPLLCSVNAVATMLLLRLGTGGICPGLPDFFDLHCNWTEEYAFLASLDGKSSVTYEEHNELFYQMKTAAGLQNLMGDSATKLRSFGAMHASEHQASHPEIERAGR